MEQALTLDAVAFFKEVRDLYKETDRRIKEMSQETDRKYREMSQETDRKFQVSSCLLKFHHYSNGGRYAS